MLISKKVVTLFLISVLLSSSQMFAQQTRVIDAAALSQALTQKADAETAQRDLVRRVLDRSDAREIAARFGLSVQQANSAVATLNSADLNRLAQHAGVVEANALAGGASTLVISTTTLLLVLIIVILLAN